MATCGSLRSLFEKPLLENPTLMESLSSWNQIKPKKPAAVDPASFTELFGELHFQENPPPSPSPSPSSPAFSDRIPPPPKPDKTPPPPTPNANANGFSKSSYGWQLCTEGLGSESSDDVDDPMKSGCDDEGTGEKAESERKAAVSNGDGGGYPCCYSDVRARNRGGFPPPISSIGRSGKPWVCFRPYREEGRFVLREIRIPSQEFLHVSREDGRLKLQFVHPDEDIEEGDDEEEEEYEDDDDDDGGGDATAG
ncbi:protein FANTASTIC FOUR 3 [Ananas comosus]|uniref:Protein FANTASTIC FOUR 3 n=2 Tax=Ananas comosus TaxID=4615 RepID=A0A199V3L6_ANACO|nr:protein FANTASTIC FOUR 3 [Ananas comosus]OAY71672.1 hypothetical protein ACMD2_11680 [Ananas comosus]